MKTLRPSAFALAAAALVLSPARAAAQRAHDTAFSRDLHRLSPHQTISLVIDRDRVTIVYGRPYTNDPRTHKPRVIWGGLVPFGKVWRLGADEATLLITQQPILIGPAALPAGAYTLFMLPNDGQDAELIVSQDIGEWGLQYNAARDIVRIPMDWHALKKPVDELTLDLETVPHQGGRLVIKWAGSEFTAPIRTVAAAAAQPAG